ncbi:MAG: hypothetical protein U9O49_01130 [Candidatus Thermoplasmatota archaeon]|nr:hypothetical protein [Candidatus Thermoplasmatota archaeon]
MDEEFITQLKEKITQIDERLSAMEKEQRLIREDILSGRPSERMKRRLLENTSKNSRELKERLDKEIKIEI